MSEDIKKTLDEVLQIPSPDSPTTAVVEHSVEEPPKEHSPEVVAQAQEILTGVEEIPKSRKLQNNNLASTRNLGKTTPEYAAEVVGHARGMPLASIHIDEAPFISDEPIETPDSLRQPQSTKVRDLSAAKKRAQHIEGLAKGNKTSLLVQQAIEEEPFTPETIRRDLVAAQANCHQMLMGPSKLSSVFRNAKALENNLTAEEFTQLTDAAGVMVKDLQAYKTNLEKIIKEQNDIDWNTNDVFDVQQPAIYINERYLEWTSSFINVVMPIVGIVTNLVQRAEANQKSKKV